MNKITLEDITYHNLVFTVDVGTLDCVPVSLAVYNNNRYIFYTSYKACPKGQVCTSMLVYTKMKSGTYDYDILKILRHSKDANMMQFTNDNLPKYNIYGGNNHHFITDDDNKYLLEFLKSIKVNLNKCASPDYIK